MNCKLPKFIEISYKDKVALIDPENKVCLGVSSWMADNLETEDVQNKLYPIWAEQAMLQKEVERQHEKINTAYLLVTKQCNMNCKFCSVEAERNVQLDQEIAIEDIQNKIVPFFQKYCPHNLIVTGGEPLIKNKIVEIIEALYAGIRCPIILQSNGLVLQGDIVDRLKGKIAEIDFSTAHMFENELKENMLIKNIEMCQSASINVVLSFMYEKTNKNGLYKFIDIAAKYDTNVLIKFVAPIGRGKGYTTLLTDMDRMELYLDVAKYIYKNRLKGKLLSGLLNQRIQVRKTCGGYGKVIAINPMGDIYMCQSLVKNEYKLGNILVDTPEMVMDTLREKLEDKEIKKAFCVEYKTSCNQCEYRYLCSGKCFALGESKDDGCYFAKSLFDYQLFCKGDGSEIDLKEYIVFLESAIEAYREN